jgi:hypothetical protein
MGDVLHGLFIAFLVASLLFFTGYVAGDHSANKRAHKICAPALFRECKANIKRDFPNASKKALAALIESRCQPIRDHFLKAVSKSKSK